MKKTLSAIAIGAVLLGFGANSSSASTTYTIKSGDTLSEISSEYGTTVQNLKQWNDLSSDLIFPNQQLIIEGQTTAPVVQKQATQASGSTYTVQAGDTLFKISLKYGTTVQQLQQWNQLSGHLIYPSQQLVVNGNAVAKPAKSTQVAEQKSTVQTAQQSKPKQQAAPVKQKQQAAPAKQKVETAQNNQQEATSMTVEATAYTAYCNGCSGITKTGIDLRSNPNQKVIAVDPSVIPLGSKVYVEGYGTAIAGDIGGAIKGNRIDVFVPSKDQAYNWGRKQVKIQVLN